MKPYDLGWLVGYLDGEGSFSLSKNFPRVEVTSTDYDLALRASQLMKATLREGRLLKRSTKLAYRVYAGSEHSVSIMRLVLPFMSKRRTARIKEVLATCETRLGLARGERNHKAKLTVSKVKDIRKRVAQGEKQVDLARHYNVTESAISCVVLRKNWKHIP